MPLTLRSHRKLNKMEIDALYMYTLTEFNIWYKRYLSIRKKRNELRKLEMKFKIEEVIKPKSER